MTFADSGRCEAPGRDDDHPAVNVAILARASTSASSSRAELVGIGAVGEVRGDRAEDVAAVEGARTGRRGGRTPACRVSRRAEQALALDDLAEEAVVGTDEKFQLVGLETRIGSRSVPTCGSTTATKMVPAGNSSAHWSRR